MSAAGVGEAWRETGVSMPRAYSADLRERVLAACARDDGSRAAIARRFSVCEATVYNWLRQAREEGRRAPKPHAGGPAPRLDAQGLSVLRELVAAQNDATLAEYAERLAARTGVQVSRPTLRRFKLRCKKSRSGRANRSVPRSSRSALTTRPR